MKAGRWKAKSVVRTDLIKQLNPIWVIQRGLKDHAKENNLFRSFH